MRRILFTLAIIFFNTASYAQPDFSPSVWKHIDTSIAGKSNLPDIHDLVQQLRQKSLAKNKYFHAARCYHYQSLIADERTEDTFYFRNSVFIDSLLKTPGTQKELQMAMHFLQAERLAGFARKRIPR